MVALSLTCPSNDPQVREELLELRSLLGDAVQIVAGGAAAPSYQAALDDIGALRIDETQAFQAALEELLEEGVANRVARMKHVSDMLRAGAKELGLELYLEESQLSRTITTYKLPAARYFTQVFCSTCGSGMPRIDPERGVAVIPMGALDDDPGRSAEDHIFVGSMAPWYTIADDLPRFEEMPG